MDTTNQHTSENNAALTPAQYNAIYDSPLITHYDTNVRVTLVTILRQTRSWFHRETNNHTLHPAINALLDQWRVNPNNLLYYLTDWREMLLEWPHVAQSDPTRLAYTRDDRSGNDNRQTLTSLGKYLKRHCPDAPDHVIRDFVAQHDPAAGMIKLVHTMDEMIDAVQTGPTSCMQGEKFDDWDHHPYEVYDPEYGWHMAVRVVNDQIMGRCLLNETDEVKCFVRSYRRTEGYSHADEGIEAWLKEQGYAKYTSWPDGLKLRKLYNDDNLIMPYLDGDTKRVDEYDNFFRINEDGEYEADNSNGYLGGATHRESCDCCGDTYDEDDLTYVGYHDDQRVCSGCLDSSYRYVYGRGGNQYYIHEDYAIWCESNEEYYDEDYLDYHDIVWVEDESGYYKAEDCWYSDARGNWFLTSEVEPVEIDGALYHPDDVPETEEVKE